MLRRIDPVSLRRWAVVAPRSAVRRFSNAEKTTTNIHKKLPDSATPEQRQAFLQQANAHMAKYYEARELFRQGKLASKNPYQQQQQGAGTIQLAVVGVFLVAFLCMPVLGKKIAQDDEFRQKWVPSWYDYTVKKPEKPWTRQELHEQMIAVQQDIRQRAIDGEFTPEKLQELQRNLQVHDRQPTSRPVPAGWNKIHPGLADDEPVNEED